MELFLGIFRVSVTHLVIQFSAGVKFNHIPLFSWSKLLSPSTQQYTVVNIYMKSNFFIGLSWQPFEDENGVNRSLIKHPWICFSYFYHHIQESIWIDSVSQSGCVSSGKNTVLAVILLLAALNNKQRLLFWSLLQTWHTTKYMWSITNWLKKCR